jgi:hypothetical protein
VVPLLRVGSLVWVIGMIAGPWLVSQPAGSSWHPVGMTVYGIGQWICHQRPERSFHMGTVPLPVCARCAGIYAGAAILALGSWCGASLRWPGGARLEARLAPLGIWPGLSRRALSKGTATRPEGPTIARGILLAGALPTAVSVASEWWLGWAASNVLRGATGVVFGVAAGYVLLVTCEDERREGIG